jgi:hypothetical protein
VDYAGVSHDWSDPALKALRALADRFPDGRPTIHMTVTWERGACAVHVSVSEEGIDVSFSNGSVGVPTLGHAAELLQRIFADEVVSVTGYNEGEPVYFGLGLATAPMTLIGLLDQSRSAMEVPSIDDVEVLRWSDGVDRED